MINLPLNIDFTDQVVVITGAGGIICGTMARAFAQAGAKVAALDLNEEAVKELAEQLTKEGFVCKGYKANVLEPEAMKEVHALVKADLGPCDILINARLTADSSIISDLNSILYLKKIKPCV